MSLIVQKFINKPSNMLSGIWNANIEETESYHKHLNFLVSYMSALKCIGIGLN